MYQIAGAIGKENPLVRFVIATDKLATRLASKIKEQGHLVIVPVQRGIASLLPIVPDFGTSIAIGPKESRPCDSQAVVIGNATMVRAIKQFLGRSKFPVRELDLPCRRLRKRFVILVIRRTCHIDNHGVAIGKHTPARNHRRFHIQLD